MKKCIKCGAQNSDKSNFCEKCGSALNSKRFASQNNNIITRFRSAHIIIKIITIFILFLIIASALSFTQFIIYGNHYTEDDPTTKIELFNEFDLDNDGGISLYEIEAFVDDVPSDKLSQSFDANDKNDNGLLNGGEFDSMIGSINGYYTKVAIMEKMENERAQQESSSTSSSSSHSSSSNKINYVDGCPECGYDEIVIYTNPDNGQTVYQCSVCDYESYDPDDFIIDERFAKSG